MNVTMPKEACLSPCRVSGEASLCRARTPEVVYCCQERPHQGKGHVRPVPAVNHVPARTGSLR